MKVVLKSYTDIFIASNAIRQCHNTKAKADYGKKDIELIDRVGNKLKHSSTIEHLTYTFDIDGISRACLQELARHRIASMTVKSTRYTLSELKQIVAKPFSNEEINDELYDIVEDFCVIPPDLTFEEEVEIKVALTYSLGSIILSKLPNDKAKYMLPEAYKTSLTWTINARSLQNFLKLRSDKSALWEMQRLSYEIFKEIPSDHKFLFSDCIKKENK